MVDDASPPRSLLAAFVVVSTALAGPQTLTLLLSAVGVPILQPVAAGIVIASAGVGFAFARWFATDAMAGPSHPAERVLSGLAIAFGLAALGVAAVVTTQRPVYDWDGLYYHIPAIHGWAQAGRVAWIHDSPDVPFVNGYPMAVETTGFLLARLLGSSAWVDATNLLFWPLGFLGVAMTATALGARPTWALFAGAGLVWSPMFVSESLTAYVDPAFATAVCATFGVATWFLRRGPTGPWSILLGLQLGLLVGTKGLGVPFVVAATLGLLVLGWRHGPARLLRGLGIAAAIGLGVAGFWFVRNVVETGNPIHPIQLAAFGRVWFDGYDHRAATLGNLPPWLAGLPEPLRTLKAWLQTDGPILDYGATGGLGWVWPLGGLPALVLAAWKDRTHRGWWLIVGLTLVFLLSQPATWWARFTLWLAAAGLPALAVALCWLAERRRALAVGLGLAFLALGATETSMLLGAEWNKGREDGRFVTSSRYYFRGIEETCPEAFAARRLARSDWSRLGVLLGGSLAQDLERPLQWIPRHLADADVQELREQGVEWVVWDVLAAGPVPPALAGAAQEARSFRHGDDVDFVFLKL